jgi:hypothetical protein
MTEIGPMATDKRFNCCFCGRVLKAWLPVAKRPDGAMRLGHLSQSHPEEVGPYLRRMAAGEDIATVAAEAFEVVEEHKPS